MHHRMQSITVAQYGIGPIGAEILRLMFEKPWIKVVAAIDYDPAKIGHDVGELIGLGRLTGVTVTPELVEHPEVVCHSTGSLLIAVEPQLRALMEHGCHVISTCEELAFPLDHAIRETLQLVARSHDVALLGTGVNPGFVMDKLPLTLSAACQTVSSVKVRRVVDASQRREPLQRKIGAGLSTEAFRKLVAEGRIRHMGLRESLAMLANGMDLDLARVADESIEPVIADERLLTEFVTVEKGDVAGVSQTINATSTTGVELSLELSMYVGAKDPADTIYIHGIPDVSATVRGGVHGDRATAAMVVNAIPRILACRPGLLSMDDTLPSGTGSSGSSQAPERSFTDPFPRGRDTHLFSLVQESGPVMTPATIRKEDSMRHRTTIITTLAVALVCLTGAPALAAGKAQLLQPTLEIEQVGGLPAMTQHAGPVVVEYEVTVHNPSQEPITLQRVELRTVNPVSSYRLRYESRPYDVKIDAGSSAVVTFTALATARGGLVGSQTPVNLNGSAVFSSAEGGVSVPIVASIGPKSTRMLN